MFFLAHPCFEDINEESYTIMNHNLLKFVKHSNLHVVIGRPIRVSDAIPRKDREKRSFSSWYGNIYWTFFDVENFVNRIAVLSFKSLTYTLLKYDVKKCPTLAFNCDESFPFSFMDFLETQRIYCGYKECYVGDEDFLTLESAKASFPT